MSLLLSFFFFFLIFFTEFLSCRQVLNLMVILGFMLNYALRVNLTIAIVAMVEEPASKASPSKIPMHAVDTAAGAAAAMPVQNDTFFHNLHSTEELSSAAHTLPISTTPEPFQNLTDKVSFQLACFSPCLSLSLSFSRLFISFLCWVRKKAPQFCV